MNLRYWQCSHCGNCYLNKPERCFLDGVRLYPSGYQSGCGKQKHLKEKNVEEIVGYNSNWDIYKGHFIDLLLANGETVLLVFKGSRDLELMKEFEKELSRKGKQWT